MPQTCDVSSQTPQVVAFSDDNAVMTVQTANQRDLRGPAGPPASALALADSVPVRGAVRRFGVVSAHRWFGRGQCRVAIRRYELPIADLPRSLRGVRIVQIADLHLGPCVGREYAAGVVERALELRPDLFVLTGDYVEHARSPVDELGGLLSPLVQDPSAPELGALAVLGNHDWYAGHTRVARALDGAGVRVIDNTRLWLTANRELVETPARAALCIAGLGDLNHQDCRVGDALSGVDDRTPRLVLSHHPDSAELGVWRAVRADAMLSGHTHGGQISLPLVGPPVSHSRHGRKYLGGVAQGPRFPVVVSRGVGMALLPVRFGVSPELVEITLVER